MNAPERLALVDVQAEREPRVIDIDAVTILGDAIYYLAGPPAMVRGPTKSPASGIDDEDIRSEEFYGY